MVKTYFCDDFEKITGSVPVPVVIAGGKKLPEMDALKMAHRAIQQGAVGVDMGRNIFQSDSPLGMIKAVRSIVQKDYTPKEAFQIYKEQKNKEEAKAKKTKSKARKTKAKAKTASRKKKK
jgi:putative autoinducer-2 (AI-2) aldolase